MSVDGGEGEKRQSRTRACWKRDRAEYRGGRVSAKETRVGEGPKCDGARSGGSLNGKVAVTL